MRHFRFTPTDDLTTLELANIFKVTIVALIESLSGRPQSGSEPLDFEEQIYNSFPDDVKKHFIETKNE